MPSDDFNRGNYGQPLGPNWSVVSGDWSTAWEGTAMSITTEAQAYYVARYSATAPIAADYEVVTPAQSFGDTARIGPAARLTSGGAGYAALVRGGYPVQLVRLDGAGAGTLLDEGSTTIPVNTYAEITLRAVGSLLTVEVDGVEEASATDSTHSAAGLWGIAAFGGNSGYGSRLDAWSGADIITIVGQVDAAIVARVGGATVAARLSSATVEGA